MLFVSVLLCVFEGVEENYGVNFVKKSSKNFAELKIVHIFALAIR